MTKITNKTFSGTSKVFDGTLAAVIRELLQNQGRALAATITDLTDSSGGTANGTIEAKVTVANYLLVSTNGAQKAATEAGFVTVKDALTEVVAQLNNVRAVVPAFAALTNSIGGTAADGTVAAVTQSVSGVGTSLASAVGVRTVYDSLLASIHQARYYVNALAVATGKTVIATASTDVPSVSTVFAAIATSTGTAVSGADATNTNAGVSATNASAMLLHLANAVTELTTKLNTITSSTASLTYVAA